jgi:hypothetical protein
VVLPIALNIGLGGTFGNVVGVFIHKADEAKRGYLRSYWANEVLLFVMAIGSVTLRVYMLGGTKNILQIR